MWCLVGPRGLGTFALTTGFVLQSYDWFTQTCFVLSITGTLKLGKKRNGLLWQKGCGGYKSVVLTTDTSEFTKAHIFIPGYIWQFLGLQQTGNALSYFGYISLDSHVLDFSLLDMCCYQCSH